MSNKSSNGQETQFAASSRPHYRTKGTNQTITNMMTSAHGTQLRLHFYKYAAKTS